MEISARLDALRERIGEACRRAGRPVAGVRLVAVTKTRTVEEIAAAAEAGVTDVGENKVQEAEAKRGELTGLRWHLVGHLQKNKAKKALELFDLVHSLDSAELGRRLDKAAGEAGKVLPALVQVDLAGETTKFGVPEEELDATLGDLAELENLRLDGLMVLPPYRENPNDLRPYFQRLRELATRARDRGLIDGAELSMGMSHDFDIAIEEGATLVRVGTALFGPRPGPAPPRTDFP